MPELSAYQARLDALEAQHLLRSVPTFQSPESTLINCCSNDYLGLAQDPRLKEASVEATLRYGAGSMASRLISNASPLCSALELAVAELKQAEAALVFNSGFQLNSSVFPALVGKEDWVFFDRLSHASLVDGIRLSQVQWRRFHHNDPAHLEGLLRQASERDPAWGRRQKWVVTESVFSMDGDCAPLAELVEVAERFGCFTFVDEAHATGLFGEQRSSGLLEALGLSSRVTLVMGTFSKALGGFGAYIAGPRLLMDVLINHARGFIYSTALPPGIVASNLKAVELIQNDTRMKENLWANIASWNQLTRSDEKAVVVSSPIVPIIVGDADRALQLRDALYEAGYYVQAVRPPTVPPQSSRLRLTLSATQTPELLKPLAQAILAVCKAETQPRL